MKIIFFLIAVCATSISFPFAACSAVFCVSNETQLNNALSTAQANTESDIIKVVQGTYSGYFYFSSGKGDNISLFGGYDAQCETKVLDPTKTILENNGESNRVLHLYNNNDGNIVVDNFTIQKGDINGDGGGINAISSSVVGNGGNVTITNKYH